MMGAHTDTRDKAHAHVAYDSRPQHDSLLHFWASGNKVPDRVWVQKFSEACLYWSSFSLKFIYLKEKESLITYKCLLIGLTMRLLVGVENSR